MGNAYRFYGRSFTPQYEIEVKLQGWVAWELQTNIHVHCWILFYEMTVISIHGLPLFLLPELGFEIHQSS